MTKIKLCGLSRTCDIETVNQLLPDYIGFVFAPKSRRYVSPERAAQWRELLDPRIRAVGVFVNEEPETVAKYLNEGIIDMAQLHGSEDEAYIRQLRRLTSRPIIQAFQLKTMDDLAHVECSSADHVLLDSGAGTGTVFNWSWVQHLSRPYFLAGGLTPDNVAQAVKQLNPYAVDVSSGIETGGVKDQAKMAAFVASVRKEGRL